MISEASSNRYGVAVAFAVVLGVGIAGSQSPALARPGDAVTGAAQVIVPAPLLTERSSIPVGAIVVADNQWKDNNNGNWNGKNGNKGDGNGQGNNGNWNKNGNYKNGNNQNWNSNNKNWNQQGNKNWNQQGNKNWNQQGNKNWNQQGNKNWNQQGNKNWNQYGNKNWSNNNHWNNNWNRNWNNRAYVRGWSRRPYYGEFFGGVVLGSILAASGVGIVPYAPEPNLCWYWADPYMYRGYWDYCY